MTATAYELPPSARVSPWFEPYRRDGDLLHVSGQTPRRDGEMVHPGTVTAATASAGGTISVADAREAAVVAILNLLAHIDAAVGLDAVERVVSVSGYVACGLGFSQHSTVIDAASAVLIDVLGERGRHSRTAVGVTSLPGNACVEVAATVRLRALRD